MRKRFLGIRAGLSLIACLALALAGCGGGAKPSAPAKQEAPAGAAAGQTPAPAAAPAPQKPARKKITVGEGTTSAVQWPYYVAQAKGFYEDANLEFEMIKTESAPKAIQALIAGGIHIAGGTPDALIKAVATGGGDMIIIGSVINKPIYSFIALPEINSFNDLKGKRVGVSALKSMDGLWMDEVLKKNGVRANVEIVEIGGTAARLAALASKAISGAWIGQPQDFLAVGSGLKLLGYSTMAYSELLWSGYSTTRKVAAKDEELIERFMAVQSRAHRWIYDPKNKDEAIAILAKATNTKPEDAKATYELWVGQGSLSKNGEATRGAVQSLIDYLVKAGELDASMTVEKVLETKYVDKAMAGKP